MPQSRLADSTRSLAPGVEKKKAKKKKPKAEDAVDGQGGEGEGAADPGGRCTGCMLVDAARRGWCGVLPSAPLGSAPELTRTPRAQAKRWIQVPSMS